MKKIKLTKGYEALVDLEDFERLAPHRWFCLISQGRITGAYRWKKSHEPGYRDRTHPVSVYMHREIINADPQLEVDHVDGNPLNNRRSNLRACTRQQNASNMSRHSDKNGRFKGAHWDKNRNKWASWICCRGNKLFLGRYKSEIEAAMAYDNAAKNMFGQFARLNFPNPF